MRKVVLVGSPNVGKSVIFNYLTGAYATVSNYPGTTVDISRGECKIYGKSFEIIDTPGIYSLVPITEEEKVTRELLRKEKPDIVVNVIDAKNIRRMLNLTLTLLEAGFPVLLTVNILDEAQKAGMLINCKLLADYLNIPVVGTSAARHTGLENLKKAIGNYTYKEPIGITYSETVEKYIETVATKLTGEYDFSPRIMAVLLLQQDKLAYEQVKKEKHTEIVNDLIDYSHDIALERQDIVDKIVIDTVIYSRMSAPSRLDKLGEWMRQPLVGIPILLLILYLGLYQFVGQFGAGFLVDYLDEKVFSQYITPIVEEFVNDIIPYEGLRSLIIGDYGLFSFGIRYASVIVLPIVGTFFLMFAVLEDSGYLPRLSMLADGLFKYFGLNGRAVIPMTLGLGCGTMAIMVTRTLETARERWLATFLLSLAIPCSAQLGLILALLSHNIYILTIWYMYIAAIFGVVGWLTAKIVPGERSLFYMEIPPLRCPVLTNVVVKAYTRMLWYFMEVLPVFLLTSLIMWGANRSGVLALVIHWITPVMQLLGLPSEMTPVFILGFFRRDYGAAGLYDLSASGVLSDFQLLIAAVVLTLFLPCVAQFVVMIKERGITASVGIAAAIVTIALAAGAFLHTILSHLIY